jgi:hypothetical protein
MADGIFISHSRKDQECVRKLAEDLNQRVEDGVWFDQSDMHTIDHGRRIRRVGYVVVGTILCHTSCEILN